MSTTQLPIDVLRSLSHEPLGYAFAHMPAHAQGEVISCIDLFNKEVGLRLIWSDLAPEAKMALATAVHSHRAARGKL